MGTSFAPKDFGTGRWDGGPATITEPIFRYREVDFGKGPTQQVTAFLAYVDADGNEHKAQFDVGNAEYCQIKESADDGAEAADEGYAIGHPDPEKKYKLSPNSDFGKLMASLVSSGLPESKLVNGDLSVLDGLEVNVKPTPRKEGDRFPLLLVDEVKVKGGAKSGAKAGAKGKGKEAAGAAGDDVAAAATSVITEALDNADGEPVTQQELVKRAMAKFRGDAGLKAAVVKLLSSKSFLSDSDSWVYDEGDKTITGV